jgi:hypothetical protein
MTRPKRKPHPWRQAACEVWTMFAVAYREAVRG